MKKYKKILLIVSAVCILVGFGMMTGAWFSLQSKDPDEISIMQFTEKSHSITDQFTRIEINTLNSSVEILPSKDGTCHIVCDDNEKLYHEVSVKESDQGTTLHITQHDEWEWYETIGGMYWNRDPVVTVYLPETEYSFFDIVSAGGDVTVTPGFQVQSAFFRTTSGNIVLSEIYANQLGVYSTSGDIGVRSIRVELEVYLENVSGFTQVEDLTSTDLTLATTSGDIILNAAVAEYMSVSAISGNVTLSSCKFSSTASINNISGFVEIIDSVCGEQTIHSTSGELRLRNVQTNMLELSSISGHIELWDVISKGNVYLQTDSGEVLFSGTDAAQFEIITSSGCVSGTLLTPKNFITETTSGYVEIPPSDENAGICYIRTVSGDINIALQS